METMVSMMKRRRKSMDSINVKRFGLAFGSTLAFLYVGCVLLMLTIGREGTILFFNSLLHGIDVTPILRMDVPVWEMIIGIIEIFILGWLMGATIACIYNLGKNKR
jgi:hypothetical protein